MPHHWTKRAAGSSVTFTMNLEAHGHAMTGTHTETLKEVGKGNHTIATTHAMMGHAQEADIVEDLPTHVGEESLKIDGREYKCNVWSRKSKVGEKESVTKIWLTESVATPLKFEISEGGESCAILAVKTGEKVSVGGNNYDCTSFDGELPTARGRAKAKMWMNAEIPGMTVKLELDLPGHRKTKMALELKEFKIAK